MSNRESVVSEQIQDALENKNSKSLVKILDNYKGSRAVRLFMTALNNSETVSTKTVMELLDIAQTGIVVVGIEDLEHWQQVQIIQEFTNDGCSLNFINHERLEFKFPENEHTTVSDIQNLMKDTNVDARWWFKDDGVHAVVVVFADTLSEIAAKTVTIVLEKLYMKVIKKDLEPQADGRQEIVFRQDGKQRKTKEINEIMSKLVNEDQWELRDA